MKWTKVDKCEVDKSGHLEWIKVDNLKWTFGMGQKGGHL